MKILFADDVADFRRFIPKGLERAGHSVDAVENGEQLLEKLSTGAYDLVITDNDMGSGITGLEVLSKIRSQARFKDLPVIVHTGTDGLKGPVEKLGGIFADKGDSPKCIETAIAALSSAC